MVYAINTFTDTNDIHYEANPLDGTLSTAPDFGEWQKIDRVSKENEILCQSEYSHTDSFTYYIAVAGESEYALGLKFSEIHFNIANAKVSDVVLKSVHSIVNK